MKVKKVQNWPDVLKRLQAVNNFRALIKWYNMYDNFCLFPDMNSEQKKSLENWLWQFPKVGSEKSFQLTYQMFKAYDFTINGVELRYKPHKETRMLFSGEAIGSGEYLGFHPASYLSSLEEQTLATKETAILVTKKLMALEVPFFCMKPLSKYTPKS